MSQASHQAFSELMRALLAVQESSWSIEQPDSSEERVRTLETLIWKNGWMLLEEFKEFDWTKNVDFKEHKRVMLLPPLERGGGLIPVLSLRYLPCSSFDESCFCMRVLLLKKQGESKLQGFGFRIESPSRHCHAEEEPNAGAGRHDFYHAQLILDIGHGPSLDLPDWWPCRQPSFPLQANSPGDAVLNLILTLYGTRFYKEFLASYTGTFTKKCTSDQLDDFNRQLLGTW